MLIVPLVEPFNPNDKADATPIFGVVRVGEVCKTTLPEPVDVVLPVPPFKIGRAVPDREIANVPELVIGEPLIERNAGTEAATEVTVPLDRVVQVIGEDPPPPEVSTCPEVPEEVGKLKL